MTMEPRPTHKRRIGAALGATPRQPSGLARPQLDLADYDSDKDPNYVPEYYRVFADLLDRPITLLELGVLRGGSLQFWRDMFPRGQIVGLDLQPIPMPEDSRRIRIYQGLQQDIALLDRMAAESAPEGVDIIVDDASHIAEYTSASFWHLFRNHLKPGGIYVIEDWGTGYWPSWPDGKLYSRRRLARLEGSIRPRREISVERGGARLRPLLHRIPARGLRETLKEAYYRIEWLLLPTRFPSHDAGMAGFVKQLVDATAVEAITWPGRGIEPFRNSLISQLRITYGQVFVFKQYAEGQMDADPRPQGSAN